MLKRVMNVCEQKKKIQNVEYHLLVIYLLSIVQKCCCIEFKLKRRLEVLKKENCLRSYYVVLKKILFLSLNIKINSIIFKCKINCFLLDFLHCSFLLHQRGT